MKKAPLILLLFLFFWQHPYSVVGQSTFDSVDEWMSSHLEDVGGRAVLLIYKDGKIVYSKSANDMNKKQRRQYKWLGKRMGLSESQATADFNPDTYLPIASCSKWLTAALFLTFVDQQKVALDDSIGRYLPEMTKHGKGHILLWQCLAHMTGIEESSLATGIREIRNSENMSQAVLNIANKNMEGTAGKSFHYGNTGLQLIAAVCEKLGGKPFENLFQESIVKPCEMQHTDFGYVTVPLAAGGAKSSANDYLKFLVMMLQNGTYNQQQVIHSEQITELRTNRVYGKEQVKYAPLEAGAWGYGFGSWVMDGSAGGTVSDLISSPGLFGTFPWVDYKNNYCAILVTFYINNKGRHDKYSDLMKRVEAALAFPSKN